MLGTYKYLNICDVRNNDYNGLPTSSVLLFITVPSCHIYVVIYSLRFVKTGDPLSRYFPHVLAICNVSVILICSLIFSSYLISLILYSALLCDKAFRPFTFFEFLFSLSWNILGHVKIQGAVNCRPVISGNRLRSQAVRVAFLVEELTIGQVYLLFLWSFSVSDIP